MHLDPREKIGYALIGVLVAAILGVYGYKSTRQSASIISSPGVSPALQAPVASEVVVHVVGGVKKSGVYRLPAESRAEDALKAAGGPTEKADLDAINLAAKVTDGEQLQVPVKGAAAPAAEPSESSHAAGGKLTSGTVSLNLGSKEELQTVPGIGPATAEKIIAWRSEHGGFARIDDLRNIGGIGDKKLSTMRPFLRL